MKLRTVFKYLSILLLALIIGKSTMHKSNHLQNEKSPYLLQHKDNPVNWYPWSDEAFEKAKSENKPIFLSIGYATCHWCHVMEHESFEDQEVAALMNKYFISIKVDREERPDIDAIYMSYCQMLTGAGGWPLTIFMTADKKPFYAATYIPKNTMHNRTGMLDLLPNVYNTWLNQRDRLDKHLQDTIKKLNLMNENVASDIDFSKVFKKSFYALEERYDEVHGGFSVRPKFPSSHNFLFLLRYYNRKQDKDALIMTEKGLTQMRLGGIYDHIGYGFHRYSTDERWLVPHFEKMLYDQAMATLAYSEAYQLTKNKIYSDTVSQTLEYITRDMTSPHGGFYSAEDADSEGVEGKFYVWKEQELNSFLNKDELLFIEQIFNVTQAGNFHDEASHQLTGENILHRQQYNKTDAKALHLSEGDFLEKLSSNRKKLFEYREKRIHPFKDDKILTDWNGLMIAAFAKAARVLQNENYAKVAEQAVNFIFTYLYKNNRLLHRYRDNDAAYMGTIDDYAFMSYGLLELFETTSNVDYLKKALLLTETQIKYFWDDKKLGFFQTSSDAEKLLIRNKEVYDGAHPSGNSIALINVIKLSKLTSDAKWQDYAEKTSQAFSTQLNNSPSAFNMFLVGLDMLEGPSHEIVITGDDDKKIYHELYQHYLPNTTIIHKNPTNADALSLLAPYTKSMKAYKNKPNIYVCSNFSCKRPVHDVKSVLGLL